MQPRNEVKQAPKAPRVRKESPRPRLRIVRLEDRIAPASGCPTWICGSGNPHEKRVREPAKAKPKAAEVRKAGQKPRLRIVKLEGRIAPIGCPTWMCGSGNHNETLVREPAKAAEVR